MIGILRKIIKPKYEPFNRIEIKADNILYNWQYLKSLHPSATLFPVLKSNAYGHGLKEACTILNHTDAKMVAVDSYPEAQIVYKNFHKKVLIMGEMPLAAYRYLRWKRTEIIIYNEESLRYISRFGKNARMHLFYNTGMNREGIKDIKSFLDRNKKYLDMVEISGFCSHLFSADKESDFNKQQEERFLAGLHILRQAGYSPRYVHLGNSAGLFKLNNPIFTAFRPGLSLYGYSPFSEPFKLSEPLRPALELYSKVVAQQELKPGEIVSYNAEFKTEKNTNIAVIPFGYYEGLDTRLFKAKFSLYLNHKKIIAPVAGRICMNLTCLNLGENKANIGDTVKLISSNKADINSLSSLANEAGMMDYELLTGLQANIRRNLI